MKLFLIRHGETVDNVAGRYAGITDSALTNHGVLQANRLAEHLVGRDVKISHIFSSDLQRAFKTAEAIRLAQAKRTTNTGVPAATTQVQDIREQDFGFYEGKVFYERPRDSNKSGKEAHQNVHRNDPGFQDIESKDSMKARCDRFIDVYLLSILDDAKVDQSVVIVAHGIILSQLWRCILRRFQPKSVSMAVNAARGDRELTLEYLGGWSNTGYLELAVLRKSKDNVPSLSIPSKRKWSQNISIEETTTDTEVGNHVEEQGFPQESSAATRSATPETSVSAASPLEMLDMTLVVKAVNCLAHLQGLKKTRGGIGSLKHDEGQRTIESFFKKRRT